MWGWFKRQPLGNKAMVIFTLIVVGVCTAENGFFGLWVSLLACGMGIARAGWDVGRPQIICPHCGFQGQVTSSRKTVNQGISGGKATAGVLTGGLSLLGTGLSKHGRVTSCFCGNCKTAWTVQ